MDLHDPHRCRRRRRLALRLLVTTLTVGSLLVVGPAPPAGASCAPPSTKHLGGTLLGEDGRRVSALVGIELFDAQLRPIDKDGCVKLSGGYSHVDRLNEKPTGNGCCFLLDHNGASSGESTWSATAYDGPIPANAAYAWIEVYPKSGATGRTTYERYGGAMRRYVPIRGGLDLRLPLGCGLGVGGDNGAIAGRIIDRGRAVDVTHIIAFSRAADGPNPIMGFGLQGPYAAEDGYRFTQLSPGQTYAFRIVLADGRAFYHEHNYGSGIPVRPCGSTPATIDIGYSPPRLLTGTTTVGVRRGAQLLLTNSPTGGAATAVFQFGQPGDDIVVGDWDGNGTETVGLRRGRHFILTNEVDGSAPFTTFAYGVATDAPVVGDWDGDGTDTIGIRRGNAYYLRNTNTSGNAQITFGYGKATDTPVMGDWDGNGTDTPGIRRGNAYYLRNTNTSGNAHISFGYGKATDTPVVGDWDGNGTDTPGIRRGNAYYLRNTNTSGNAHISFGYGKATDTPVVGDWDGNGTDTPGIRRGNTYYLRNTNTSGNAHIAYPFGLASDKPLVGDWDGL